MLFTQNQMANLKPLVGANAKVSEITKLAAEKYRVLPMAEKNVSYQFIIFESLFLIPMYIFSSGTDRVLQKEHGRLQG